LFVEQGTDTSTPICERLANLDQIREYYDDRQASRAKLEEALGGRQPRTLEGKATPRRKAQGAHLVPFCERLYGILLDL
jgi:hypothetical protein